MNHQRIFSCVAIAAAMIAPGAIASNALNHHLMQIEQVIGGVEGDLSAQAIQLRMRTFGQNIMTPARLVAYDANGENPIVIVDFTSNVPNGSTGDRVLICSENFVDFTDPPCAPDYFLTTVIPESYLAAGRIVFENDAGTRWWSLAHGGDAYTGPNDGSSFNDDDGDFGAPILALPVNGDESTLFQGGATDQSTTNELDYALSNGPAVFTNNAGSEFTIDAGGSAILLGCDITFGSTDNFPCNVANLEINDDVDQILRSQFGFSAFERNLVEIRIDAEAGAAVNMTAIFVRDSSDTTNVVAKVKARNYVQGVVQEIGQYDVTFPNGNEIEHEVPVGSTDFIESSTGIVEVLVRYVAPATFTPLGFTAGMDQLEIGVN